MNLFYRLLTGENGTTYSPSSASSGFGGNPVLGNLRASHSQSQGNSAPTTFSTPAESVPYTSPGFLDVPVITQAFGPLPTGFGVATRDARIQVDTEALEGTVDGGRYL